MPNGPPARIYQKSKIHSTGFAGPLPYGPRGTSAEVPTAPPQEARSSTSRARWTATVEA